MPKELLTRVLKDIRVELSDEFDRNFTRKAFFTVPWESRLRRYPKGSLMTITNRLRRSFRSSVQSAGVRWTSDAPYAHIHNEGGKIKVTPRMRAYYWAQYYRCIGAQTLTKKGQPSRSKKNIQLSSEAIFWRNMALHRSGTIVIPKRQVIGNHPRVEAIVKEIADNDLREHLRKKVVPVLTKK